MGSWLVIFLALFHMFNLALTVNLDYLFYSKHTIPISLYQYLRNASGQVPAAFTIVSVRADVCVCVHFTFPESTLSTNF